MSTAELKSNIHDLIEGITDKSALNLIYGLLSKISGNKAEAVVLSAAERKAVDEALKSVGKGKVQSHEKVMADMKKKYPTLIK